MALSLSCRDVLFTELLSICSNSCVSIRAVLKDYFVDSDLRDFGVYFRGVPYPSFLSGDLLIFVLSNDLCSYSHKKVNNVHNHNQHS